MLLDHAISLFLGKVPLITLRWRFGGRNQTEFVAGCGQSRDKRHVQSANARMPCALARRSTSIVIYAAICADHISKYRISLCTGSVVLSLATQISFYSVDLFCALSMFLFNLYSKMEQL